jgi:hypothetical protein
MIPPEARIWQMGFPLGIFLVVGTAKSAYN